MCNATAFWYLLDNPNGAFRCGFLGESCIFQHKDRKCHCTGICMRLVTSWMLAKQVSLFCGRFYSENTITNNKRTHSHGRKIYISYSANSIAKVTRPSCWQSATIVIFLIHTSLCGLNMPLYQQKHISHKPKYMQSSYNVPCGYLWWFAPHRNRIGHLRGHGSY